ncbi:MAG: nicotinate-nucleotide adenylyltransferase [Spirochaetota bacterium]|jgi:nicotinate-nucleotide adenylyltransferase|nr:nicotinate-nucleotide adenylyltransferase [Spirochaetota bacterium]
MRRAIFGGSFDPVHIGHLIFAETAADAFSLDRVIFMPAAISPFKKKNSVFSDSARCALLRAAITNNPKFELSTLELERGGISYTIDTLLTLGATEQEPLYCLIGADIVPGLAKWHKAEDVARLTRFIVARRGAVPEEPASPKFTLEYFDSSRIDISSTMIREHLARKQSVRYLVPDAVHDILFADELRTPDGRRPE